MKPLAIVRKEVRKTATAERIVQSLHDAGWLRRTSQPPTDSILRATDWRDNSELMQDMHQLGYIRDADAVLDPTYGRGTWWKHWRPANLTTHDLFVGDGVDFRSLPEDDSTYDVVTFDPPYIAQGGRASSTLINKSNGSGDFLNRYGIDTVPTTPDELHDMNAAGIKELLRVLKPGGVLLVKGMNYVNRNRYSPQVYRLLAAAEGMGFTLIDEFVHLRRPGPQPKRTVQRHSRANYSMLFVLQAPK